MDAPIVAVHSGNGIVSKRSQSRSIRKRKFALSELNSEKKDRLINSDYEGPFWFEKSSTSFESGEKIHAGITRRERQLLKEIVKSNFFTNDKLKNTLVPLNDETSNTPRLRSYDWAVTNFAKGQPCLEIVNGNIVDPNLDYQNALKKHHRLLFDPFRRGSHLFFQIDGSEIIHRTTVGQLCFIKWCIEHEVDKYVEKNVDAIRKHMSKTMRKTGPIKRRRELTAAPKKMVRGAILDQMTIN